jgi:hypothetical protein
MFVGFAYLGLRLSIVGYLIPDWVLAVVLSDLLRLLSYIIFSLAVAFYGLGKVYSYWGSEILKHALGRGLLVWVYRTTAGAGTRFTNP